MPNTIIVKAKAVNNLGTDVAFSAALALNDGTKDIAAKFSLTVSGSTIPMVGITQYGKLAGLVADDTTAFSVTATPLDGSSATTASTTVAAILAADIGDSLG